MSIKAKVDDKALMASLDRLANEGRVSLARSMGVAGGSVLRDEAKQHAPVGMHEGGGVSPHPGTLRDSIYLAFREGHSTDERIVYSVSWNHRTAPHGGWLEFGHWRVNELVPIGAGGMWVATKERLEQPVWVPAQPFMRPAMDAWPIAEKAMLERGRQRFTELMRANGGAAGNVP
jgi:hypothetical protein